MIYLKKIIAQDLERTPTFSQESWEFFFKLPLDNEEKISLSFTDENDGEELHLDVKRRTTRNEIRAFIKPILYKYNADVGDLLILKNTQHSDKFRFKVIKSDHETFDTLSSICINGNHHLIISDNIEQGPNIGQSIEENNYLNTIFYGPAGTGKTYISVERAVELIDGSIEGKIRSEIKTRFAQLKDEHQIAMVTFHQSFSYEEFVEGISVITNEETNQTEYKIKDGVFKLIAKEAQSNPPQNYVLIIDEINRGNVSKIFGELITLLEPSKRLGNPEELKIKLPYTQEDFGVPKNLYIIGTMNSSDRSLTSLDVAMRRRFVFEELLPDTDLLKDIIIDGIAIQPLLEAINERIEYLVGRDYCIGHAYFTSLLDKENQTVGKLANIFKNQILPLLQEYFYADWEKIDLVLGCNQFIRKKELKGRSRSLFDSKSVTLEDVWMINSSEFEKAENYKLIYSDLETILPDDTEEASL